jgi:hypothetical protein
MKWLEGGQGQLGYCKAHNVLTTHAIANAVKPLHNKLPFKEKNGMQK